jgi:hypothetical protein
MSPFWNYEAQRCHPFQLPQSAQLDEAAGGQAGPKVLQATLGRNNFVADEAAGIQFSSELPAGASGFRRVPVPPRTPG